MKEKQSVRRASFEADTFCHLNALWRTAMWLTMSCNAADNLVLETMTRAYREWQDSEDLVSSKARLFRILTKEFFAFGKQKQQWQQSTPFLSEDIRTTAGPNGRNPQTTMAATRQSHLPLLAELSHVAVKGAITRLRPQSRLMLILLYRERFSYADIAYITDHSENTIKAMLARLRRLIPRYFLETADCLREATERQTAVGTNGGHTVVSLMSLLPEVHRSPISPAHRHKSEYIRLMCRVFFSNLVP